MTGRLAVGYEADITVVDAPDGNPERVIKTYRQHHPCIAWLNERLTEWYDPAAGLPVAQHEWAAYRLLAPEQIVPEALELRRDAIVLGWGGESLRAASRIGTGEYGRQAETILRIFGRVGFRHNDLDARNVLVDHRRVRVIDFTLAEFSGVQLMDDLPDHAWARAGQDDLLLDHLRSARRDRRSPARLLDILRGGLSTTKKD